VQQETKRLSIALTDETTRRENAEKQATEIGRRRQELESELTKSRQKLSTLEANISESKDAQAKLQQDLEESRKQLQTQTETSTREQFHLQQRINELQVARIELEQKLEAGARDIRTLTADLTAVRTTLEDKALQQQKLAEPTAEFERFKAELTTQAEKAATQIKLQESSILFLDSQLRDRNGKIAALESTLQSERAQRCQDQSRIETLENDLASLTALLSEKAAEQQRLRDHESELAHRIARLNDELAQSCAEAGIREAELARLTSPIDDLRIVESALCARVREITALHDAACKRVQELESKGLAATREIANRDLELAGLRYTVLDAVRIAKRFSRERIQADCQAIDTWKSLIGTLLETPLSKTQRGMVTEIVCALDGWKKGRASATPGAEFQVESLELHNT
jgi:chromosome segregation ATPase